MSEIIDFPFPEQPNKPSQLAGTACPACGRTIDDSGICRCDPEWISPAERNKSEQVSELVQILREVRSFLSVQVGEVVAETPTGKRILMCRGCATRWVEGEVPIHHIKCWPNHMINRITNYMKGENLE